MAASNERKADRYNVTGVFIELEHQPDGKKRATYMKESYTLSAEGVLKYSAYFGGMPMHVNHMDSAEWKSGEHGRSVFAVVGGLLADPAHGPGLREKSQDDASGIRGVYRVSVTDDAGRDSTWYARPGTKAFEKIHKTFGALIAAFEKATGRPKKPDELSQ